MSDELTEAILGSRGRLEKRLSDINKITEVNEIIMLVVEKNLETIKKDLELIGRGGGTMKIINNSIALLEKTTNSPEVLALKIIIREQIIVLLTGSLENYLSDTIKVIGNTKPEFFRFKSESENISFNQSMLLDGFTLGDAILEHIENKKYSFQDLKSTIDVFENYLDISLVVDEIKDLLILMAAMRHIIIHNNSIVDRKFLKQIRDTSYKNNYFLSKHISVDDKTIDDMMSAIKELSDQITSSVINRDDDEN